jgi:hypothetical protein
MPPTTALPWLDSLFALMPGTVHFEASSSLLIAGLVALWIWRHPRR